MKITKGSYITDNSDLLVYIHQVKYRGKDYFKAKISLFNKKNKIFYETGIYKIYNKNITHWKRFEDL